MLQRRIDWRNDCIMAADIAYRAGASAAIKRTAFIPR